jgi:hypothetical protein
MSIGAAVGDLVSGGVLGLAGSIVSEVVGYFRRKQEHSQWLERTKLLAEKEAAKTAGDLAVAREKGAADAFTESFRAESALKGEHRWVTSFRAFTRPGLTWLGMIASVVFCAYVPESYAGQQAVAMLHQMTGMMVSWWFGQRALDRMQTSWGAGTINGRIGSTLSPISK